MKKNIAIVGAGIVGLCSGYHLLKKGHQVTFFYNSFRNLATGILSCSLYFAIVRRAIL